MLNYTIYTLRSKNVGMLISLDIRRGEHSFCCCLSRIRCASEESLFNSSVQLPVPSSSSSTASLVKKKVNIAPTIETHAQSKITCASPTHVARGRNSTAPSKAPILPLAAHMPFKVERIEREKVMLGSIKVYGGDTIVSVKSCMCCQRQLFIHILTVVFGP